MIEVNQPDKATHPQRGKTDIIDAESAAHAALSGRATATAKTGDGRTPVRRDCVSRGKMPGSTYAKALVVTSSGLVDRRVGAIVTGSG